MRRAMPSTHLDPDLDERLVRRCLAGEARAWEALVRRHERLVYAVARSYRLGDSDLADVFQEVFAALVRGLPRLRETRTLCRWLSSTTERIARATALRRRREAGFLVAEASAPVVEPAADLPPVGADLEQLEEQAFVRLALAALPARCRDLLHALYYEDAPPGYAELSRRLGMPIGSLGPTRARCFERLRRLLVAQRERSESINPSPSSTSHYERQPTGRSRRGASPRAAGQSGRRKEGTG